MRDDDDDDPKELGRIYYSGINPDADRADYALPRGLPALEDGEVEFEKEGPHTRLPRRRLIGLGLGICALGSTAGILSWFGSTDSEAGSDRRESRRSPPPPAKRPDWVEHLITGSRQAAEGRMEDLVLGYPTFLMVVGAYGEGDPKLWQGMERLAKFAELDRSVNGYEIAKRMIASFKINAPPPHFTYLTAELEDLVRRWEMTRGK